MNVFVAYTSRLLLSASLLFLVLLSSACTGSQVVWKTSSDYQGVFAAAGVEGTFTLHRLGTKDYKTNDRPRAESRFLPASTFKIFNALVALETGAVADEHEIIPWDGVERSVPAWNKDHDLASGIRASAVWYFQELARRIGADRMQAWIDTVGYGNKDIGGDVDAFWLTGNIRISPIEQIDLLERLYKDELPFSQRSMRIVKDILKLERAPDWTLSGKTGWGVGDEQVGWFVGYVEREGDVWIFANNITIEDNDDARHRIGLTKEILRMEGILSD